MGSTTIRYQSNQKLNWNQKLVNMNFLNYSKMVGSQVVNITKENLHIGSILC